jgi:ATP-binding cassette subfamily B protein
MEIEQIKTDDIKKASLNILKNLKPYLSKFIGLITVTLSANLAITFLSAIQPMIVKSAIDNYIVPKNFPGLLRLSYLFLGLIVLLFFLNLIATYVSYVVAQRTVIQIRKDIFSRLLVLSNSFLGKTPIGVLITRTANDTENLSELMASGALQLINDFLLLFVTVFVLVFFNLRLALITLLISPFVVVLIIVFSRILRAAYEKARNNLTLLNIFLQENLSGISIIKLFNRKELNGQQFRVISQKYQRSVLDALKKDVMFNQIINFSSYLSKISVILFGGLMIVNGKITVGTFFAFFMYVDYFYNPLRDLGERFNILQDAAVSMAKIGTVLYNQDVIPETKNPQNCEFEGTITFEDVTFAYEDQKVLDHVSFTIKQGEKIAIVGPTGAGKSTMMNLILRLYDLKEGTIKIDNQDIKTFSLHDLRSHMAIVLQDVFIFKGTVLENITLGRDDISEQMVTEAAKYLNAHDFISNLSHGYQTELNTEGSNLSLGQKQLISFVRALVFNPKILLLDEATSSVDTTTERIIQEGIEKLMKGRTSIVIAHRLSTIIKSDRIFVIKNGKIVEEGNHKDLITKKGFYWDLYTTQFGEEGN